MPCCARTKTSSHLRSVSSHRRYPRLPPTLDPEASMIHVPARVPRARGLTFALAACLLFGLSAPGQSQILKVQGDWVGAHVVGGLLGVEGRHLLGSPPPLPGSGPGPMEVSTKNWILTGMLGAGVNLNAAGSAHVRPIFYLHVRVLRRTGSDTLTRVGVLGVSYIEARAVGPAQFLEFQGVGDLKVGALHTPGGWKPSLSLAVHWAIVEDLRR